MNKKIAYVHYINGDNMLFLCIKIFFVRILDVSLGTVRTIMTVRNKNFLASVIGFIEISVWFLVVREALTTTDNSIYIVISYALGFSTGTYIGGLISNRYIKGYMSVYVISDKYEKLVSVLRDNEFGVSSLNIKGMNNDKVMLLIQINSSSLDKLKSIINKYDSKAFVIINDTKYVQNGFIKR